MMSNKNNLSEIEKLTTICRKEESKVLFGKYELCLNQSLINYLNDCKNNNNSVIYLRSLLTKSPSIKIIGDNPSRDSTVYLSTFVSCVCLNLIRIPFKGLIGLDNIRSQLKSLTCIKCFETQVLDEEFWDLFGVWPLLITLKLCHSNITSVNASIIPSSVQTLDLSWNRIKLFNNISNYSVNSITKLDLSYNALNQLPKLNNFTCNTLKSLFLRSNLIENIDGIEKFVKLEELDIANNCVIDLNSFVFQLNFLNSLKSLWIEGNPLSCVSTCAHLIRSKLSYLTQLDGINFINDTQFNSSVIIENNKYPFDMNNEQVYKNDDNTQPEYQSLEASFESVSDSNNPKTNPKKKKLRIAQIKDQTDVNHDLEKLNINYDHMKSENLSQTKQLIIEKRKQLGDEWLVSLRPSFEDNSFLSNQSLSPKSCSTLVNHNESIHLSISPPVAESTPRVEYMKTDIPNENLKDDIEVLIEEKAEWSRKELENDSNIIIVDCPDTNETLFLYVREDDGIIFEKDCVSGKVLRTYDLKVLISVEIVNNSILKLCFETRVTAKRERKYLFVNIDSCQAFYDQFITPWIAKRKSDSEEVAYECLKCGFTKMSKYEINPCSNCGSDHMMRDENRRRRSGSDITVLSQIPQPVLTDSFSASEETIVWDEMFSINSHYDHLFFTTVDHSLKLYIEVKLMSDPSADDEVVEAILKCKTITGSENKLKHSLLVICSKQIMVLNVNQNENRENYDLYYSLTFSKPIQSLVEVKHLPNQLNYQGLWFRWKENNRTNASQSRSRSIINRLSSKKSTLPESITTDCLIIIDDQLIGKAFLNYFNETISKMNSFHIISNISEKLLIDDMDLAANDELIIVHMIESCEYQRSDMKNQLILNSNGAIVVTEKLIILGQIYFYPNSDYRITIIYKELIINLLPEIYIDIKSKIFKLIFSDENIKTNFIINLSTTDSIKRILAPIKSIWEKAFEVQIPLYKL